MVINNSLISFLHQISFSQDDYITKTDLGHNYVFTQTIGFSHAVLVRCPKALINPRFYVPGFTTDSKRALQTWLLVLSVIKSPTTLASAPNSLKSWPLQHYVVKTA